MSWFDSFLGSSPSTSSYNLGGSNPTGNLSFEGFMPSSSTTGTLQTFNSGTSNLPEADDAGSGFSLESLGSIGGLANVLAGLGNAWNGFQQQKLAKKSLNFQKDAFNRTFANNNKVYNQNMEDVLRARSAQTGNNYDKVIAERRL